MTKQALLATIISLKEECSDHGFHTSWHYLNTVQYHVENLEDRSWEMLRVARDRYQLPMSDDAKYEWGLFLRHFDTEPDQLWIEGWDYNVG